MYGSFKAADEAFAEMERPDPAARHWSSSSGTGEDRIGYDEKHRIVGFRNRIFGPPPEGHAILLLIADDDSPDGVRIIQSSIPAPHAPSPPPPPVDKSLAKDERARAMSQWNRERHAAWSAALQANEEYRRFMQGSS
jgi:hypothetical protein